MLGLSACGSSNDDDDPIVTTNCNSSADCAGNTNGKTECNLVSHLCVEPSAKECLSSADCANREDGLTECDTDKNVCVRPKKSCKLDTDCESNLCTPEEVCATSKMVTCKDEPPANATTLDATLKVEVTFADGHWSEPAVCPWYCGGAYQFNENKDGCVQLPSCTPENAAETCRSKICGDDGKCSTVKTDACRQYTATELAALHATEQDTTVTATYTFVEQLDGSASWVTDGYCPITKCEGEYVVNEAKTACSTDADSCTKEEECSIRDDGKIHCEIPEGENVGTCIKPECTQHSDCKENANGPFCHNSHCSQECWFDSDCANMPEGKTMCDNANGVDSTWECVLPECEPAECSDDRKQFCVSGHWTDCPLNKVCATTGGEGITGTCQVPSSDLCSPACSSDEFCRDNGDSISDPAVRYTCELKASANTGNVPVVISQYYFGGYGNSATTPTYAFPFIELYNAGSSAVDLKTYKLIKGTKAGSFSTWIDFSAEETCQTANGCSIPANKYFRIRLKKSNSSGSTEMPVNMIKETEKIAIDGSIALVTSVPSTLNCQNVKKVAIDLIGMNGAFCSETAPASGVPGTEDLSLEGNRGTMSFQRDENNIDSGSNYYDFTAKAVVLHSIN